MRIAWHPSRWWDSCVPDRKIVGISMGFFVSGNQIQKFFDQQELQIKMSSVAPFTFNAVELCIVNINEKPWSHAREV